jgi:hypothetical protein
MEIQYWQGSQGLVLLALPPRDVVLMVFASIAVMVVDGSPTGMGLTVLYSVQLYFASAGHHHRHSHSPPNPGSRLAGTAPSRSLAGKISAKVMHDICAWCEVWAA